MGNDLWAFPEADGKDRHPPSSSQPEFNERFAPRDERPVASPAWRAGSHRTGAPSTADTPATAVSATAGSTIDDARRSGRPRRRRSSRMCDPRRLLVGIRRPANERAAGCDGGQHHRRLCSGTTPWVLSLGMIGRANGVIHGAARVGATPHEPVVPPVCAGDERRAGEHGRPFRGGRVLEQRARGQKRG